MGGIGRVWRWMTMLGRHTCTETCIRPLMYQSACLTYLRTCIEYPTKARVIVTAELRNEAPHLYF